MDIHRLGCRTAVLLVLMTTLAGCVSVQRWFLYWLLAAVAVLVGVALTQKNPSGASPCRLSVLMLLGLVTGVFCASFYVHRLTDFFGQPLPLNMDLGFFAQLAETLPLSGLATFWSASLGAATRAAGETSDIWYHWGPIFLTSALSQISGIAPLKMLLGVVAPCLDVMLVITVLGLASRLTGCTAARCIPLAVVSLLAISFPSMSQAVFLTNWLPTTDVQPHLHITLASQFSYKFEGVLILSALNAWLGGRSSLAIALLFAGAISAPHTVALGGLTAGVLGCHSFLTKNYRQLIHSVVMMATCFFAWASMKILFGVGLPKMGDSALIHLQLSELLQNFGLALVDLAFSAVLTLLLLPGLIYLWKKPETRLASSLALSALIGSHLAYRMLLPDGDRAHFTMLAYAVLVCPIGTMGLGRLWYDTRQLYVAIAFFLVTGIGLLELSAARQHVPRVELTGTQIQTLSDVLKRRPFGYLASNDRNWWISQHAVLAGQLGTYCLRLNKIPFIDEKSQASRFYGSQRVEQFVPRLKDETDSAWALRLAKAAGIRHVIQFPSQILPQDLVSHLQQVAVTGDHTLWEIKIKNH